MYKEYRKENRHCNKQQRQTNPCVAGCGRGKGTNTPWPFCKLICVNERREQPKVLQGSYNTAGYKYSVTTTPLNVQTKMNPFLPASSQADKRVHLRYMQKRERERKKEKRHAGALRNAEKSVLTLARPMRDSPPCVLGPHRHRRPTADPRTIAPVPPVVRR